MTLLVCHSLAVMISTYQICIPHSDVCICIFLPTLPVLFCLYAHLHSGQLLEDDLFEKYQPI